MIQGRMLNYQLLFLRKGVSNESLKLASSSLAAMAKQYRAKYVGTYTLDIGRE